jgi:hypothetical protein
MQSSKELYPLPNFERERARVRVIVQEKASDRTNEILARIPNQTRMTDE